VYPHPLSGEQTAITTLAGWQTVPQAPQFDRLIGVSQPLVLSPSQSRYPGLHALYEHPPLAAVHAATVTWSGLQGMPQPPQFGRLNGLSHPLLGLPSQSRYPGSHCVSPQLPWPSHAELEACAVVHALPMGDGPQVPALPQASHVGHDPVSQHRSSMQWPLTHSGADAHD
jgi:hypothetical protein